MNSNRVVYVVLDQYGNRHEAEGRMEWSVEDAKEKIGEMLNKKAKRKKIEPLKVVDIVDMVPHSRKPFIQEKKP